MIASFFGEHRFLSNFYQSRVSLDGDIYPTVENAYQAAKTEHLVLRTQFFSCTPSKAKMLGKQLKLRSDWETVKLGIMENLLRQKFSNSSLNSLLKSTGSQQLIEGNTWGDTFWGICDGHGQNHLGKLLMKIRGELA